MTLDALNTEIANYRNQAIDAISRYREHRRQIEADTKLTSEGKHELLRDTHRAVKEGVAKLQQQEDAAVAAKQESLQRSLVARLGSNGADVVAMRDAEDRADKLNDSNEAMRAIERAVRMDDRSLAHAVIRRANEAGWTDVVDKAAQAYPSAGEAIKDLAALHQYTSDLTQGFVRAATYVVGDEPRFRG